jgi:hypothetical protein
MGPHIAVARMPIESERHRAAKGRKITGTCWHMDDIFHLVINGRGNLNGLPVDGDRAFVAGLATRCGVEIGFIQNNAATLIDALNNGIDGFQIGIFAEDQFGHF